MFERLIRPEQASTVAGSVDGLTLFATIVTVFMCVVIFGTILYFAIRYRRRSEDEVPVPVEGATVLEVAWSIPPLIVAMILFFWGASVFFTARRPPKGAMEVYVVGRQWMWKIQHPTGQREINELHVPRGRAVKLTMTSEDVIHSFFIPAFRVKMDVLPGRYTTLWFEATRTGRFKLFCAEYCGTKHAIMGGHIVVMEPAEYQAWLAGGAAEGSLASRGQQRFESLGCDTCHRDDSKARGPSLDGIFGEPVRLRGGRTHVVDEAYIRESILDPGAKVVEGYEPIMPTYAGVVDEVGILELIAYIRSLKPAEAPRRAGPAGDGEDR